AGEGSPAATGNFEMASVAIENNATYMTNIAITGSLSRAISGRFCRSGALAARLRPALGATKIPTSRLGEPGGRSQARPVNALESAREKASSRIGFPVRFCVWALPYGSRVRLPNVLSRRARGNAAGGAALQVQTSAAQPVVLRGGT